MKRVLVCFAMAALVAACGGGSGLTKAEYVRRANTVCRDAAEAVKALELPDRADVTKMPKAAANIVEAQRDALDRLRAIKPPKEARPEVTKWIALVDQTIDQAEVSAKSQQDGDIQRAVTANVNGTALDRRADQIARSIRLRMCVQAASAPVTRSSTTKPGGA